MLTQSNLRQYEGLSGKRHSMNQLCRQVSIESPAGHSVKECVFNFEVPVPEVPPDGVRLKIVCAGACYRMRNRSASASSISSVHSVEDSYCPGNQGIRDGALFAGYEVSGIIDALGDNVTPTDDIDVNKRVILYPYDGIPHGYAEYIVVNDTSYLVPIPDNLSLGVAAMLPTGALLAKSAVAKAHQHVTDLAKKRPSQEIFKVLIVGMGGLALWAIRIAQHQFKSQFQNRVQITVASLKDEGFKLTKELQNVTLVQWNEEVHEKLLIDRTKDACNGLVDIVIDFGTTSRSLHRSLQCLNTGGVVIISDEVAEKLLPKFSSLISKTNQRIEAADNGSIEQLKELVEDVAAEKILPPPYSEFSADEASTVVQKLCRSEIPGRAILRFHDIQ